MVGFWTNHFNGCTAKGADKWLIPAYDRDVIWLRQAGLESAGGDSEKPGDVVLPGQLDGAISRFAGTFAASGPPHAQWIQRQPEAAGRSQNDEMDNVPRLRAGKPQTRTERKLRAQVMELHTLSVDGIHAARHHRSSAVPYRLDYLETQARDNSGLR
jgi:hypothetical protein